jgi:hypothetical protein
MVKATKKMASSTKVKMASLREALAEKFASEEKEDDQGVIPIEEPSTDEENSESQKAEQEQKQEQELDESDEVEQNEEEIQEEEEEHQEEGEELQEEECELQALLVEASDMLRSQSRELDGLRSKLEILEQPQGDGKEDDHQSSLGRDLHLTFTDGMTLMGISLLWLVALVGADQYLSAQTWMIGGSLPTDLVSWSIGSGLWSFHVLHQLKKAKTILAMPLGMRIQTGIGVSLAVGTALMLSKEEFRTVTNIWAYGSIFALLVLFVSGFGGAFKRALVRRFKGNTIVSD